MRLLFVLLSTLLLGPSLASDAWAGSSAISKKLGKIAKSIAKEYKAKHPETKETPLAIFTFSSSRVLERRRVGFAVSELLHQYFVRSPDFRVVERTDLNKVLREQKLQLTGAVDSDTAVRVGKLLGARTLLLGSVEKLGGKYHVTARLVDAESGEVAALGYGELAADLFERAAEPYLALVPQRQAIGVFLFYSYRRNKNSHASVSGDFFGPFTVTPKSFDVSMVGGGIRYFPKRAIAVEASVATMINSPVIADAPGLLATGNFISMSNAIMIRGALSWVHAFSPRSRSYLGGSVTGYQIGQGSNFVNSYSYITPTLRVGYEFKVQQRLGIALFANYDLTNKTGTISTGMAQQIDAVRWGKFHIEPSVALYF